MSSDPRSSPAFDRDAFLRRADSDPELVQALVEVFDADRDRQLVAIERAVAGRDALALENAAHALKGALGVFAAGRASSIAERLESMGRAGGVAGSDTLLSDLREEVGRVVAGLNALVEEMRAAP